MLLGFRRLPAPLLRPQPHIGSPSRRADPTPPQPSHLASSRPARPERRAGRQRLARDGSLPSRRPRRRPRHLGRLSRRHAASCQPLAAWLANGAPRGASRRDSRRQPTHAARRRPEAGHPLPWPPMPPPPPPPPLRWRARRPARRILERRIDPAAGGERRKGASRGEPSPRASAAAPRPSAPGAPGARSRRDPRIALVIDDLGRSLDDLENLRRLGVPLTYAVLPFESQTPEVVANLREAAPRGDPLPPADGAPQRRRPRPRSPAHRHVARPQLRQATLAALAAVPGAAGANNHMGSGLSANAPAMSTILEVLAAQGLFFLDSRTSAQSVAYRLATSLGVPAAEQPGLPRWTTTSASRDAVAAQFQRLLDPRPHPRRSHRHRPPTPLHPRRPRHRRPPRPSPSATASSASAPSSDRPPAPPLASGR